ncbi:nucleotide exchange factor GrpE [Fibrobacter sp.]|uniref:nucleotide exchange factor GrpE n=1 Tax=Fibrobacter sp. TaxID=35828 RepID=UPI0025B907DB|nr:nucleotide exchange factor GrpE [Fibrobacter sp.]MCI6437361.1 nucleotide exchange factor GrpE [Fibrobacter sp.]
MIDTFEEFEQKNQSVANEKAQGHPEASVLNATDESSTEQEPSEEPAGDSEPNKSEPSVSDELQKVNASLQELKKAAQEKEKLLQMNAEMHDELVGLRNGLADAIRKPLLMGLIQIYDRLEDLVKVNSNLPESEASAMKVLKTVNDIRLNCLDLLYEFDVEPVEPRIGDMFNPKEHKAIKTIMTDDAANDRTISSVRQIGFVNVSNSRMLRVGSVEVYKKQE